MSTITARKTALITLAVVLACLFSLLVIDVPQAHAASKTLNYVAFSDIHNRTGKFDTSASYWRGSKPEAVILSGDLTDLGKLNEYRNVKRHVNLAFPKSPIAAVLGNHDGHWRTSWADSAQFGKWVTDQTTNNFKAVFGTLNPYIKTKFANIIGLGDPCHNGYTAWNNSNLALMEKRIKETSNEGKWVFVVSHYPINASDGDLKGSKVSKMRNILNKYPNVVYVCGHYHEKHPGRPLVSKTGNFLTVQMESVINIGESRMIQIDSDGKLTIKRHRIGSGTTNKWSYQFDYSYIKNRYKNLSPRIYLQHNPDVVDKYGTGRLAAYSHYAEWGHTENRIINAKTAAQRATYTVTFKDGITKKTIKTQKVKTGKNATAPNPPKHAGYTFNKWSGSYKNIKKNTTVTAVYKKTATYTVTFKDGVNNKVLKTQKVEKGKNATPPKLPKHNGYAFSKWSGNYKNVTSNRTITAVYSRQPISTIDSKYTITYHPNGGYGLAIPTKAAKGQSYKFARCPFIRFGYKFVGWNTKADGSGTTYWAKQPVRVNGDMHLYAQWRRR